MGMKENMTLEATVNNIIANGARIEERMSGLGNILPFSPAKEARIDTMFAAAKAKRMAEGARDPALAGLDRRTVGGEVRYYKSATIYTPVELRGGVRRWFETRKDGDYCIK